MRHIESLAAFDGANCMQLGSMLHATGYYNKLGYRTPEGFPGLAKKLKDLNLNAADEDMVSEVASGSSAKNELDERRRAVRDLAILMNSLGMSIGGLKGYVRRPGVARPTKTGGIGTAWQKTMDFGYLMEKRIG